MLTIPSEPVPSVDVTGQLFGLRTPGMQTPSYQEVTDDAHGLVERLAENEDFSDNELHHRRGDYASWAPKLHTHYHDALLKVESKTGTKRYFSGSAFAAATVKVGPAVCTSIHRDIKTLAYGWCAITALGKFDHTKGGHLILWDAKLIIEFPAGSTIFIPSATLSHSNIPIQSGERRASFTQYTAGGLFRWIDNEFKTDVQLQRAPAAYRRILAERDGAWMKGLTILPTIQEPVANV